MIAALIAAAGFLLIPILMTINSRFAIVDKQLTMLEESGAVTDPIDVSNLMTRVVVLSEKLAAKSPTTPTGYIVIIRRNNPGGIQFSGFTMENSANAQTIKVTGMSSSRERLQQFVAMLAKDEAIEKVDSPVSNYVKSNNGPFVITVIFKPHE